jgi:hypothetical protein
VTDQVSAGAAGQTIAELDWGELFTPQTFDDLHDLLVPSYAAFIPATDAWGNLYEYGATTDHNDTIPIGVRSPGADAAFDAERYTAGAFVATDFVQDIVWAGGFFVRWPAGHLVN